jgi:hypothetical protein
MSVYKIVIFANIKYLEKCEKRLCEFKKLGIDNYVFYCIDTELFDKLSCSNKELFLVSANSNKSFRQSLWLKRTQKVYDLLENSDILHCDADAEWLINPTHFFENNPQSDIFLTPGLDFPRESLYKWGFVVRGGLYYIRSSKHTRIFIDRWIEYIKKYNDDQIGLNKFLLDNNIVWNRNIASKSIPYYLDPNYKIHFYTNMISGFFDNYNIGLLSAYDFPRLVTSHKSYIIDLHDQHKVFGSMPE